MRVTQSMLSQNTLSNISKSYEKMAQYQNQLSSGKKITQPSDDPVVAMNGMYYRSDLNQVNQYQRNLTQLHSWMDNSDSAMTQGDSDLQRIRELLIRGQDGALTATDRTALADEVGQLKDDLVKTSNTQVAGKYIFHGNDVMNPPVPTENPPMVANNLTDPKINSYNVEVSNGVSLQANVNPANTFSQQMFDVVGGIQNALQTNNPSALDGLLTQLDGVMDTFSAERSDLGARSNRLDVVENRLNSQEVNATQVLSDNEDVDIEKVIMNLTNQENVQRAALGVGARVMQPSLLDFLK